MSVSVVCRFSLADTFVAFFNKLYDPKLAFLNTHSLLKA